MNLDYEKRYKRALEKARELLSCCVDDKDRRTKIYRIEDIESIFPELLESNDERIREMCMKYLDREYQHCSSADDRKNIEKCITWLEKRGEKDPCIGCTDDKGCVTCENGNLQEIKIEPKFKVGDWCIDDEDDIIFQIVKVLDNTYTYRTNEDKEYSCTHYSLENDARLWTIQDAKDGDVLVCNINKAEIGGDVEKLPNMTPTICIYQNVVKDSEYIHSYCSLYDENSLVLQNTMYYNTFVYNIHPATKEQRELLFRNIKEAGYQWDSKNRELKKIELRTLDPDCDSEYYVKQFKQDFGLCDEK